MEKEGLLRFLKKFWNLLWKDESLKGWIFAIVFLFVFVKFIFFPFLYLVTGTKLPLAIVESCSMYHKGNLFSDFDDWWERHEKKYAKFGITKKEFESFIFPRGFDKGDIIFMIKAKPENLKVGDVISFDASPSYPNPIIHRIVKIEKRGENYIISTIGDNNNGQLSVEKEIQENQLVGKAVFRAVPFIGWGKLIFYDWKKPEMERGLCSER